MSPIRNCADGITIIDPGRDYEIKKSIIDKEGLLDKEVSNGVDVEKDMINKGFLAG